MSAAAGPWLRRRRRWRWARPGRWPCRAGTERHGLRTHLLLALQRLARFDQLVECVVEAIAHRNVARLSALQLLSRVLELDVVRLLIRAGHVALLTKHVCAARGLLRGRPRLRRGRLGRLGARRRLGRRLCLLRELFAKSRRFRFRTLRLRLTPEQVATQLRLHCACRRRRVVRLCSCGCELCLQCVDAPRSLLAPGERRRQLLLQRRVSLAVVRRHSREACCQRLIRRGQLFRGVALGATALRLARTTDRARSVDAGSEGLDTVSDGGSGVAARDVVDRRKRGRGRGARIVEGVNGCLHVRVFFAALPVAGAVFRLGHLARVSKHSQAPCDVRGGCRKRQRRPLRLCGGEGACDAVLHLLLDELHRLAPMRTTHGSRRSGHGVAGSRLAVGIDVVNVVVATCVRAPLSFLGPSVRISSTRCRIDAQRLCHIVSQRLPHAARPGLRRRQRLRLGAEPSQLVARGGQPRRYACKRTVCVRIRAAWRLQHAHDAFCVGLERLSEHRGVRRLVVSRCVGGGRLAHPRHPVVARSHRRRRGLGPHRHAQRQRHVCLLRDDRQPLLALRLALARRLLLGAARRLRGLSLLLLERGRRSLLVGPRLLQLQLVVLNARLEGRLGLDVLRRGRQPRLQRLDLVAQLADLGARFVLDGRDLDATRARRVAQRRQRLLDVLLRRRQRREHGGAAVAAQRLL
mmetsp:Transcript_18443/g.65292  ORF Transcript_18443/g.65292 Transcript_18443/m.65292 type:complete len:691 (-) Transcript_18443:1152-3224(-)